MASSPEIRDDLARVLALDLVGPDPGSAYEHETLSIAPSRFYLSGFLAPREANEEWKSARDGQEDVDTETGDGSGDDERAAEKASARKVFFPSSMGLTVCVGTATRTLSVTATWGDYEPIEAAKASAEPLPEGSDAPHPDTEAGTWQRAPRAFTLSIPVKSGKHPLAGSSGVEVVVLVRPLKVDPAIAQASGLSGVRTVSLFLVNDRVPETTRKRDQFFLFQARLTVSCADGFAPRPDLRGIHQGGTGDIDEAIADLQYRDTSEYGVGHGVGTRSTFVEGRCTSVTTAWIPSAQVEKVDAARLPGEFGMKRLAEAASAAELTAWLTPLTQAYRAWITTQRQTPGLSPQRQAVSDDLMAAAGLACDRIEAGLAALAEPKVFRAFTLANAAMDAQARRRNLMRGDTTTVPAWRPFQLAFVLMNLRGIVDPAHADRELVDLLFFPTGGGKTEAYLGLAAFTLLYRRLTHPGLESAGVSVLMRYTLRLLTLDQLQRAATLVCALEQLRLSARAELGEWPFEIGLWVGRAATPNRMGKRGDQDEHSARKRVLDYLNDSRKPLPVPLENCPWCGAALTQSSFRLEPNQDEPRNLVITCANRGACDYAGKALPVLTVDEPIYRRLPCFLIATMDKFAALPWEARTGALFGRVDRADGDGFYGPADEGLGTKRLPRQLPPPDLIIQDELHLISGPLGTIAGLYEAVIEQLATATVGDRAQRPKVVASTATVRRAQQQIRELFARARVEIFPPPGPDKDDSFFARTVPVSVKPARLYLGVAAPGRSLKVVLLRTYLALLGAAQKHYLAEGGEANLDNPADPYMTLLGYFNSLRELGGSRRIIEDEVLSRADSLERTRARANETLAPDFRNRVLKFDVMELTSRETNASVARARRRLEHRFHDFSQRVDVAIATNMISVGLDIPRLGLMVVNGQPKTTAEYIQATSRVGRDEARPGLVVTLLNVHKPRDRSHFERFEHFHRTFYRSVEATSVTPFSPRAVDRALVGVVVGLARHGLPALTAPRSAIAMQTLRSQSQWVADALADRATRAGHGAEAAGVSARAKNLLDDWQQIAKAQSDANAGLQYQRELGNDPALLHTPLDPELEQLPAPRNRFRANRSLRDVEPTVNLFLRALTPHGDGPLLPEN
jgi:hypothetical protein